MTLDEIKQLPAMTTKMTNQQIADHFGVHRDTIKKALKRLRDVGYKLPKRKTGRPSKIML